MLQRVVKCELVAARTAKRPTQVQVWGGAHRVPPVAKVDARIVVKVIGHDVDAGVETGAAEGGVAGLLVEVVGSEYEGFVGGVALCLVDRHGVAVVEMAGVEVAGRHDPVGSVGESDRQGSKFGIERRDHASKSVQ